MVAIESGKKLSVRIDDDTSDALRILMRVRWNLSDAVCEALRVLATIYGEAWESGYYPPGYKVIIEHATLKEYDGRAFTKDV